jgi:hypothetical protein
MTVFGIVLERHFSVHSGSALTPLSHKMYWDGGWFLSVISGHAYETNAAAPVFYPLFPLTISTVQVLSGHLLNVSSAALVVNTVALWFALVALVGIARNFVRPGHTWLVVALFLLSPAAIFMHFLYAETLFCAFAFWAYLFALQKKWLSMAVTLALLTAIKIPAILIIGLCALEFMRANDWDIKKTLRAAVLYFALTPLGFIAYGLYLKHLRGDFLAMFHGYHATHDWDYHVFNPNIAAPIFRALKETARLFLGIASQPELALVNSALPAIGLGLLGLASLYGIFRAKGKLLPLGIAGLMSIVFFSINNNLVSVHRYLLPSVILYIVPIVLLEKIKQPRLIWAVYAILAICLVLQFILFSFFVGSKFAG